MLSDLTLLASRGTMTTRHEAARPDSFSRIKLAFGLALLVAVPALWLRLSSPHVSHALEAVIFGLAIVGAAFVLSWAAEVAQLDIAAGLALAVLALIAVLPEYAVDFVFAWQGGHSVAAFGPTCPSGETGLASPCSLALANMTGANRLLIGIGWSSVVFIAWYRSRRPRGDGGHPQPTNEIALARPHSVEIAFLLVATVYSLTLPLKHSITLIDSIVLVALFVTYMVRLSRAPAEEPHLVGPARWLGTFGTRSRRITVVALFAWAAFVIVMCAEPFAHALVSTGRDQGVSEFFLVQWLAPLASEAPEFIVAGLFAWRLQTDTALGALVSSKVNQWTLLVGSLPLVFAIASHSFHGLPIEGSQRLELLLTGAQSLFAVALISNLRMSVREAWWVFGLFTVQFVASFVAGEHLHEEFLVATSAVYLIAGAWLLFAHRRAVAALVRDGLRAPYEELTAERS
jgi:cation:H+ antiporter